LKVFLASILLIASVVFSYTVTVYLYGDYALMYDGEGQKVLSYGENTFEYKRPVTLKFSAFYGHGYVWPEKVTADSTTTIYVLASLTAATVDIDTSPEGADIFIVKDGHEIFAGKTPFRGFLPRGELTLRLKKEGYGIFEKTVEISGGKRFSFDLPPKYLFKINSTPPASLLVESEFVGETPCSTVLLPGTHLLEFTIKGVLVESTEITIKEDSRSRNLLFKLPKVHTLTLKSSPWPAFATVLGETFRAPIRLNLIEGKYGISCKLMGYEDWKGSVDLDEDKEITCEMKRKTFRMEFSDQVDLKIDGKYLGKGEVFQIPGGIHLLEIEKGGKKWLKYTNVESNRNITIPENSGTVVILLEEFYLDSKKRVGPTVLTLKSGKHTLFVPGEYNAKFELKSGDIRIFPDTGALFVLSNPPSLKLAVSDGKELFEVLSPEIIGISGNVTIKPLEGCKIGIVKQINLKKGEYKVVFIDSNCEVDER
jgi:hypothetical protein